MKDNQLSCMDALTCLNFVVAIGKLDIPREHDLMELIFRFEDSVSYYNWQDQYPFDYGDEDFDYWADMFPSEDPYEETSRDRKIRKRIYNKR